MKFGKQVGYGPHTIWLNFGSDPEHIRDILMQLFDWKVKIKLENLSRYSMGKFKPLVTAV